MSIALPHWAWQLYSIVVLPGFPRGHGPGVLFHCITKPGAFAPYSSVVPPAAGHASSIALPTQETWSTIVGNESWTHTAFSLLSRVKIKRKKINNNLTIK